MGEDTAVGGVGSVLGQGLVPLQVGGRVVGTVDVVLVEHGALVVGTGLRLGLGLGLRLRLRFGLGRRLGLWLRLGLRLRLGLLGLDGSLDDRGRLGGSGSRSGRLDEDGDGLGRGLGASGDGDSDHLENPLGLHGALVDGASHGEEGAGAGEEERGLHLVCIGVMTTEELGSVKEKL